MSKARSLADLGNVYDDGALSNRSMVINGGMTISQRGDSTGVTGAGYYGPDRYRFTVGSAGVGTYTISQDTDAPSGFGYSYKIDCTTADASPDATDAVFIATRFEGQDLQRLKKGTADAASVTLSFWVKSNLTGTYQANLFDLDNTRIIGSTYTISVAGTWEYKTITFAGDTSGAFSNDNGLSLQVEWALDGGTSYTSGAVPTSWEATSNADRAAGLTVNLADNTANYWQLTGVQLEIGDTSTPFEHRSYSDQLQACQRYYWDTNNDKYNDNYIGTWKYNGQWYSQLFLPVEMRAVPTATYTYNTNYIIWSGAGSNTYTDAANSITLRPATTHLRLYTSGTTRGSDAEAGMMTIGNAGGSTSRLQFYFDAEL